MTSSGAFRLQRDLDRLRDPVEREITGRGQVHGLAVRQDRAEVDRLGQLERRRRELRSLDALAAKLTVTSVVVALQRRQVGLEVAGGHGVALDRDAAVHVRRAADRGVRADRRELLLDAVTDERAREVRKRSEARDRPSTFRPTSGGRPARGRRDDVADVADAPRRRASPTRSTTSRCPPVVEGSAADEDAVADAAARRRGRRYRARSRC